LVKHFPELREHRKIENLCFYAYPAQLLVRRPCNGTAIHVCNGITEQIVVAIIVVIVVVVFVRGRP